MKKISSTTPNLLVQIGKALMGLLQLVFKTKPRFDREKMLARWREIENLLAQNDPVYYSQAIIRADSFLDEVMKGAGGTGQTYADRLRSLEHKFDRDVYQKIWNTHKLRNHIAHEHSSVSGNDTKNALESIRRGSSQLGAF